MNKEKAQKLIKEIKQKKNISIVKIAQITGINYQKLSKVHANLSYPAIIHDYELDKLKELLEDKND